jgi:hypothetical protein
VIAPIRQGQRLTRRSALKVVLSREFPRSAGARASLTPADPFEGVQTWLVGHPLHVAAAVAVLALVARLLAPRPAIRAVRPAQAR